MTPSLRPTVSRADHRQPDAQGEFVGAGPIPGPASHPARPKPAPPDRATTPGRASLGPMPTVHPPDRAELPTPPKQDSQPRGRSAASGPILEDARLYLLAAQLDNVEALRIAVENRHRQATRDVADVDGHLRGLGLPADDPVVAQSAHLIEAMSKAEHSIELALNRQLRLHPLGGWQKAMVGIGEKQLARLLAVIGDPYWNVTADAPRTVSQLWAYCGLHVLAAPHPDQRVSDTHTRPVGVAARRKRGERANWSATAKSRVWLIAASCLKQERSPYRKLYDEARTKHAEAVHVAPCAQCGPAGKPAQPGSALRPGHQHARGMRVMSKEILKDLWIESRRLHLAAEG
jgi:hypothetical protein